MCKFSALMVLSGIVVAVGLVACGSSEDGADSSAGGSSAAVAGGAGTAGLGGAAGAGAAGSGVGGSGGQGGGDLKPGTPLSVEDYCKGIVGAFCDTQYECCGKNDSKRQACMSKHVGECVNSLNQKISSKVITYHGEYAAACAEESKAQFACQMDLQGGGGSTPNCDATIEGMVEENGMCTKDDQCVEGLKCNEKQNSAGQCYKPAPKGQPCGKGCADGLVCLNNTCGDPLATGEKCTSMDQCGSNGYCNGIKLFPPGGEGVCAPKKKVGEPCDPKAMFGIDCEDMMCDPGTKTCSDRMRDICQYN